MPGWACCNPAGFITPDKARLLELLEELVDFPAQPRLWGARDGMAWRLVGARGEPPAGGEVTSPWTIRALVEADRLKVDVQADGTRIIRPQLS